MGWCPRHADATSSCGRRNRRSVSPSVPQVTIGQCDELLPTSGGRSPSVDASDGIIAADSNFPQAAAEARADHLAGRTARLTLGDRAALGIPQEVRRKHSGLSRPAGQSAVDRNSGASTTHGRRGGRSSGKSCRLLPASERRPTGGAPGSWRAEPPAHVGHRLRQSTTYVLSARR